MVNLVSTVLFLYPVIICLVPAAAAVFRQFCLLSVLADHMAIHCFCYFVIVFKMVIWLFIAFVVVIVFKMVIPLQAFAVIASSPLRIDLKCVLDHVVSELTSFLRKVEIYCTHCLLP